MTQAQLLLQNKYLELRKKNPRFTQRAFALRLGLSSGALSELLAGKRPLTPRIAQKIADRLGLEPAELAKLKAGSSANSLAYESLSQDQFRTIADWWHFAILNLIATKGFKADAAWIASRLGISKTEAKAAIERLIRLGMIVKKSEKTWMRGQPRYTTTDEVLNLSVQRSHLEDLELIKAAISNSGIHDRDMTSITFALDPSKIKEAKDFIRRTQDEFIERFANKNATEVYRLSSQLFPLSQSR